MATITQIIGDGPGNSPFYQDSTSGAILFQWSEPVTGFTAADITPSHPLLWRSMSDNRFMGQIGIQFVYAFAIRDAANKDDFFVTVPVDAVDQGNPLYTFPVQGNQPSVPRTLAGTVSGTTVTLTWLAPENDGGVPLQNYEYQIAEGATASGDWTSTGDTELTVDISDLDGNQQYTVQVRAVNLAGESDPSNALTFTTDTVVPDAPTGLRVTFSPITATLTWTAGADDGGSAITRYEYQQNSGDWTTTGGTTLTHRISELSKNTAYSYQVRAVNTIGNSEPSNTVSGRTPATEPSPPTGVSATVVGKVITLSWVAPTDTGGVALQRYEYRFTEGATAGGAWRPMANAANTSMAFSGLDGNQQYTFEVRARNRIGVSPASDSVSATTDTVVPDAPEDLTATMTATTAILDWDAGDDDGGSAITRYEYRINAGTWTTTGGTDTEFTITGLARDTAYAFEVRAVNAIGNSEPSSEVDTRTLETDVAAPTDFTVTVQSEQATLQWTAPTDTQGEQITGYDYRFTEGDTAGGEWTPTGSTITAFAVTGLEKNTEYTFQIRASTTAGSGKLSVAITETTLSTAADAPTSLTVEPSQTTAELEWVAPLDTGGVDLTHYEYRIQTGTTAGGTWRTTGGLTLSFTITGLTKGTQYTAQVRAVNSVGNSQSNPSITFRTQASQPSVPRTLTVATTQTTAVLRWNTPTDAGGTGLTQYQYQINGGTWQATSAAALTTLTFTVRNLTGNTQYRFAVRAVNNVGASDASNVVTTRTSPLRPSAPRNLRITNLGSTTVTLAWVAPESTGGAAITQYQYRVSGGAWQNTGGTTRTHTITGLTHSTAYSFQVRAVNNVGASDASNSVRGTTRRVPPATVTVTTSATTVTHGRTATITATFNKDVTGITRSDFTATVGSLSGFVPVSATVYRITWTAPTTGSGTATIQINRDAAAVAGNNLAEVEVSYLPTPTITLTATPESVGRGANATIVALSDIDITGIAANDFAGSSGTLTNFQRQNARTYTIRWTAPTTGTRGTGRVVLRANAATEQNPEVDVLISWSVTDATVSVAAASSTVTNGGSTTITYTFNKDVSGFGIGDLQASIGSLGTFQRVSARVYRVRWTAPARGTGAASITLFKDAVVPGNPETEIRINFQPRTYRDLQTSFRPSTAKTYNASSGFNVLPPPSGELKKVSAADNITSLGNLYYEQRPYNTAIAPLLSIGDDLHAVMGYGDPTQLLNPDADAHQQDNFYYLIITKQLRYYLPEFNTTGTIYERMSQIALSLNATLSFERGVIHVRDRQINEAETSTATGTGTGGLTYRNANKTFDASGFLLIQNEVIGYTNRTSNTFSGLTRGANGTTPVNHPTNTRILQAQHTFDESQLLNGINETSDANRLFNVIRNADTSVEVKDTVSVANFSERVYTLNLEGLTPHETAWQTHIFDQYLQYLKDIHKVYTFSIKPTFYLQLGDTLGVLYAGTLYKMQIISLQFTETETQITGRSA